MGRRVHFSKPETSCVWTAKIINWLRVWAKIQEVGTKPLLIAAYYKPHEHDQVSAEELKGHYI